LYITQIIFSLQIGETPLIIASRVGHEELATMFCDVVIDDVDDTDDVI
jgi:hypothetical protein